MKNAERVIPNVTSFFKRSWIQNYPDNLIQKFVECSAQAGIDVFRIFDSLNWVEGMRVAIDAVRDTGKIAEATMCYTGIFMIHCVVNMI